MLRFFSADRFTIFDLEFCNCFDGRSQACLWAAVGDQLVTPKPQEAVRLLASGLIEGERAFLYVYAPGDGRLVQLSIRGKS